MGSRLKQNPERTFYWFFEATCPVARDKDPDVVFQFPDDFSDEESRLTLPRFCFPYDVQRLMDGVVVQHFTFVLTDLEGCQRFGFCRLTKSTHTCLCILSYLPWFEVFYKLLNNLADYLTKGQTNEMKALLAALYKQPLPLAAGSVTLQMVPYFIAPDPRSLPSIPENRNLTELIVAVDVGNLLQLYASMLFERRILIFASKLSSLTACVHALSAVLYPMYWQHIFIPVLPPHLLDYCCAPMPYLIGVHTSLSEKVRSRGLEEVVILNVDTNTLESPFDDLKKIPSDVMSELKVCLKRQAVSPGSGVSRAFLRAQALLFGGYRDALQGQKEGDISFSEELFLDHKSPSMRQFLKSAIHLQFFKQFIDGRLDIMNKGKEPEDLFEEEILTCETTTARSKSYQHLVGHLKKEGGALFFNMKSKANIKAKRLAKTGLKNLLMQKATSGDEHKLHRGGSVSHRRAQSDCLQNRLPITQHFGMSRPRRPVDKNRNSRYEDNIKDNGDTWDGAVSGPATEPDSELQKDEEEDGEEPLLCDPEEMDLLGEIFDTLSSRSSHERGLLYGTRSLDLFGPDSHDYITKRCPGNPIQDSLSLSISGSGSLHSWNLETTEELSDLEEDSDGLCLDTSFPEEERTESLEAVCEMSEQERGQREHRENQEEVKMERNGSPAQEIDNRNFKEVTLVEEEIEKEESFIEGHVAESVEIQREGLQEIKENDINLTKEESEDEELQRNEKQEGLTGADEEEENQEKDAAENILYAQHLNPVEEQHEQEETPAPETTVSPGPRSIAADPQPSAEKTNEEVIKIMDQNVRQTHIPPKVRSAVALFQAQGPSQGFQVKSRTKAVVEPGKPYNTLWSRENTQTSNIPEENNCPDAQEEENRPPVKVSELKKKFEA